MKVRRTFIAAGTAVIAAAGFAAATPSAQAAPNSSYTCDGELASGTYGSVWVPEGCVIPDGADVTVVHGISVAADAFFDASTHSTLAVHGNVSGGPGSFVALGCTEAHPCDDGEPGNIGDVTVDGNVSLDHVYDAAINGVTIGGNLTSVGGGAGLAEDQFIPFSVKDDTIGGNVSISGLQTTWFVANTIHRNLICSGLSPAPQLGDAVEGAPPGYGPNDVGGKAVGQCVGLTS
jgi:hypothetical protein